MNRGNATSSIFHITDDYQLFIDMLEETIENMCITWEMMECRGSQRKHTKYDQSKLSLIFGGIYPTNISKAINRKLKGYEHICERPQMEIQNAKRRPRPLS